MASGGIQSLSSLLQQSSIDDHQQILKTCNATLQKSKNDLLALHVKAVALLKLDRYEDSLRVLEAGGESLQQKAALEYAYALYKCGRLREAAEVAGRLDSGRGPKHIQAQAVGLMALNKKKTRQASSNYSWNW
jgi:signal recognition particle subunit SRP72